MESWAALSVLATKDTASCLPCPVLAVSCLAFPSGSLSPGTCTVDVPCGSRGHVGSWGQSHLPGGLSALQGERNRNRLCSYFYAKFKAQLPAPGLLSPPPEHLFQALGAPGLLEGPTALGSSWCSLDTVS